MRESCRAGLDEVYSAVCAGLSIGSTDRGPVFSARADRFYFFTPSLIHWKV